MSESEREVIYVTRGQIESAKVAILAAEKLGKDPNPLMVRIAHARPVPRESTASSGDQNGHGTTAPDELDVVYATPGQIATAKVAILAAEKLGKEPNPLMVRIANAQPVPRLARAVSR